MTVRKNLCGISRIGPKVIPEDELKLIHTMRKRNPHAGLVVFWVKLRQRGYTRTITDLYRILHKSGAFGSAPLFYSVNGGSPSKRRLLHEAFDVDRKFDPKEANDRIGNPDPFISVRVQEANA